MPETMRTFVALVLPEPIISDITSVQNRLRSHQFNIRWVAPKNIHLTLSFLGNIPPDELENIFRAVFEAAEALKPFTLTAAGVGVFPTPGRPRVIWIGVAGETDRLVRLKKCLDTSLMRVLHGYKREKRPYHAHLTMGRVKGNIDPSKLASALKAVYHYRSDPFAITEIHVVKSRLTPGGAIYSKLKAIPLKGVSSPY